MSRKVSELARFLKWFRALGEEARGVIGDQLRDELRVKKPQVSRRGLKHPDDVKPDIHMREMK